MVRWGLAWGVVPLCVLAGAARGGAPSLFEDAGMCVRGRVAAEDGAEPCGDGPPACVPEPAAGPPARGGTAREAFALVSLCLAAMRAREEGRLAEFVTRASLAEGGAGDATLDAQQRLAERHAQMKAVLDRYAPAFAGDAPDAEPALRDLAAELRQLP
ncbi:MAG: hypothetical protein KDG89_16865 [Geminicoccaceae bacterium]|nr:hypothetical protein [Geminicoccaceae bacterium]